PGFLTALADAMRTPSSTAIRFVYYGRLYELRQQHVRQMANVQIDRTAVGPGRTADFVVIGLHDGEKSHFSMTYGVAGPLAGVPIAVTYQPRGWMQVELTIADPPSPRAVTARVNR